MPEASGYQHGAGGLVHVGQEVLRGRRQGAPRDLRCQCCAPLQRQLVQGDVIIAEPQRRLQPPGPGIPALPRQPEDEVDGGSAGEEPPRRLHSPPCLHYRVLPAQQPQLSIVQ